MWVSSRQCQGADVCLSQQPVTITYSHMAWGSYRLHPQTSACACHHRGPLRSLPATPPHPRSGELCAPVAGPMTRQDQWGRESRGAEMSAQTHGVVNLSIHGVSHICTAHALRKEMWRLPMWLAAELCCPHWASQGSEGRQTSRPSTLADPNPGDSTSGEGQDPNSPPLK